MRIFLTGATGFVGKRLVLRLIHEKNQVVVLTRNAAKARAVLGESVEFVEGNPTTPGKWQDQINGVDAVINLAGEPVFGKRWSPEFKAQLVESRINTTQNLVAAILKSSKRPAVMVSASAIGYYGTHPTKTFNENSPAGDDFLADLALKWEKACEPLKTENIRTAIIRIGVVLDPAGGALQRLLLPFKFGLGGRLGSGEQWVSWIHLDDLIGLFLEAVNNPKASGAFNGVSPQPLPNGKFSASIAEVLHRPCFAHVPAFVLKQVLGEVSEVVLKGQRVIPERAKEIGFQFKFPTIQSALTNLLA